MKTDTQSNSDPVQCDKAVRWGLADYGGKDLWKLISICPAVCLSLCVSLSLSFSLSVFILAKYVTYNWNSWLTLAINLHAHLRLGLGQALGIGVSVRARAKVGVKQNFAVTGNR